MRFSGMIDIDKGFVVHGTGSHLLIAGGQKLDHIIPELFILGFEIAKPELFEMIDYPLHNSKGFIVHFIAAEL